jgi:hypothetical protein
MENQPELLYHYTSLDNFKNIIDSNELWFTNVRFLNDSSEFDYSISIFEESINEMRSKPEEIISELKKYDSQVASETLCEILSILEEFIRTIKFAHPLTFLYCFSELGDQLSQWRGYTKFGSGVSIAFNFTELYEAIYQDYTSLPTESPSVVSFGGLKPSPLRFDRSFMKCTYDRAQQKNGIVGAVIEIFANNISANLAGVDYDDIWTRCLGLKHPAFLEEKEWRAILKSYGEKQIYYRTGKHSLIPYTKEKFEDISKLIDHIIIGPNPNKELSKLSLESFLEGKNIGIKFSDIPYRDV